MMFHAGDRVRVTEGTIFGHYSGRAGTVLRVDDHINVALPISVQMDDRASGKLMIDHGELVGHFDEQDLIRASWPLRWVERPTTVVDLVKRSRAPLSPALATVLGMEPITDG